ncbi:MAG TPA: M20 family metallopeptidase [Polyangiaceae bacterium]|nr:M20 family metallopeptidase [Polyangiaceae bacterium]
MSAALEKAISGRTEAMLSSIQKLVEINSHTPNKAGGDAVAALLVAHGVELGLTARRIHSSTCADHVVLTTGPATNTGEGATLLVGHHDTVFPPGTFEGMRVEGGIARGPGVLDMKGGIVVMLEALRALREAGILEERAIRVILVGDEEVGSPEGRNVIQAYGKGAKRALVFEAGRAADKIITRRKGTGSAKVVARGKAAHAANNHKDGVNAIWALSRFIDRAQALTDYARGITVNVGLVSGGEAKNTVPDHAECQIDFRFEKIADAEETFSRLRAACDDLGVPGAALEITGGPQRLPLERTPDNVALFEAYAVHARAVGLGSEEAGLIAGGSDASSTSAIGIPSIDGLGPRGSGFHTKDELIEIASLEPKALALARLLAE